MRLSTHQIEVIKEEAKKVFGPEVRVSLFGSRVDADARGGDIDLFVEADFNHQDKLALELKYRAHLLQRLGYQRIDVVVHRPGTPEQAIHREARLNGVRL